MKKQLNVDQIQSELRGGSAFFPGYKGGTSPTPPVAEPTEESITPESPAKPNNADEVGVPPPVPLGVPHTVPRPGPLIPKQARRPIRQRQPFDIYEDQYQSLKKIADAEREFMNGRGMSQMVREAIDHYLRDHTSSKK
jgi:hypothetical protein